MNQLKKFMAELQKFTGIILPVWKKEDGKMSYSKKCTISGMEYKVVVTKEVYDKILARVEDMQYILPGASPEEREFLISGTTPAEWEDMLET